MAALQAEHFLQLHGSVLEEDNGAAAPPLANGAAAPTENGVKAEPEPQLVAAL